MFKNLIDKFNDSNIEVNSNGLPLNDNILHFYNFDLDNYYNKNININPNKKILFDKIDNCLTQIPNHIATTNIFAVENNTIYKKNQEEAELGNNSLENISQETKEKIQSDNIIKIKKNTNFNDIINFNNHNTLNTSENHDFFINKVLQNLRSYLKLENFPKKMRKFILDLILRSILILKISLIKWLISQILSNNGSNSTYLNKNNLLFDWVNLHEKMHFENYILNSENSQDLSDEEIHKFLDIIDPIEKSDLQNMILCEFCNRPGPRKFSGRLIHLKNELWGHVNCIIRSKGVFETTEGNLINVSQIFNKIKAYRCFLCRKLGATIICDYKKCGKNYHFSCALAKQSVFTKTGKFYCLKCCNSKEELITNFDTKRRIVVVKNNEFINDSRINYVLDYNFNKILPKYFVGSICKFGNTSILKFFNLNRKELSPENYDINIIKIIDRFIDEDNQNKNFKTFHEKKISNEKDSNSEENRNNKEDIEKINGNCGKKEYPFNPDAYYQNYEFNIFNIESGKKIQNSLDKNLNNLNNNEKKFLLLQVNEHGMSLSELENLTNKDLDTLLSRYKILYNFEKSDFIINTENQNLIEENSIKNIRQVINIQSERIISLNPSKDNFEFLMKNTINKFNGIFNFKFGLNIIYLIILTKLL